IYTLGGLILGGTIFPSLPDDSVLKTAVGVYGTTILTMLWKAATWYASSQDSVKARWGLFGAGLFVFSDWCLAYAKFVKPLVWEEWLVMGTYYAAQYGLAMCV
ncbi:hypothetical protein HDV05_003280, partial [Chytridiales sp. JEL 0842]